MACCPGTSRRLLHRRTSPQVHFPTRPSAPPPKRRTRRRSMERRASTPTGRRREHTGPSAPPPLKARAHVIIFDCHPHHSPTRRGTSPPPGTGRPKRRAVSDTRRFGHAPFRARAEFGSNRQRRCRACSGARTRAHASAHDGALHSRTSFECAAPPLNGAIFLRCENMNASPDEGGTQRSSEVISDHQ